MGGPDRPRGRAKQCGGEGLCLEEGGGVVVVVSGVVRAVREGVVDGGGGGCRDGRQVSGYDLRGQRLTLPLLTQRQLYLSEREKHKHSQKSLDVQTVDEREKSTSDFLLRRERQRSRDAVILFENQLEKKVLCVVL